MKTSWIQTVTNEQQNLNDESRSLENTVMKIAALNKKWL